MQEPFRAAPAFLYERQVLFMICYAGEWHGHKIQVETKFTAGRVLFDGLIAAESEAGLRLGSSFDFVVPGFDSLHCYILLDGSVSLTIPACYCIIGVPLDTAYNKKTKIYTANYNSHTIEAISRMHSVLLIDGEEVDREPNGLRFSGICAGAPDENGKRIMAVFDGVNSLALLVKCRIFADAENIPMSRFAKNGDIRTAADENCFFFSG